MQSIMRDRSEIEYLDGLPYPKVSPRMSHGLVRFVLATIVADCAADRGFVVPEVRFDSGAGAREKKTEFVPDIAFVSHVRREKLLGKDRVKPPFSPDLAIEVRSSSSDLRYLAKKMARYLATGSLLVLDVDPKTRRIVAHAAVPWLKFAIDAVFADLDLL